MPVGEVVSVKGSTTPSSTTDAFIPPRQIVSVNRDWVDVCTAPDANDNSAAVVTEPGGITRPEQNWLLVGGAGTHVAFRLKYDDDVSDVTSPIVQVFGEDANGVRMKLKDANGVHELTLTVDTTNDVSDGTLNWTDHLEVDAKGCQRVFIAVRTAFAASGTVNTSVIEAKVF